jgi:hypothetical protein
VKNSSGGADWGVNTGESNGKDSGDRSVVPAAPAPPASGRAVSPSANGLFAGLKRVLKKSNETRKDSLSG